jgi:hypothetical protein
VELEGSKLVALLKRSVQVQLYGSRNKVSTLRASTDGSGNASADGDGTKSSKAKPGKDASGSDAESVNSSGDESGLKQNPAFNLSAPLENPDHPKLVVKLLIKHLRELDQQLATVLGDPNRKRASARIRVAQQRQRGGMWTAEDEQKAADDYTSNAQPSPDELAALYADETNRVVTARSVRRGPLGGGPLDESAEVDRMLARSAPVYGPVAFNRNAALFAVLKIILRTWLLLLKTELAETANVWQEQIFAWQEELMARGQTPTSSNADGNNPHITSREGLAECLKRLQSQFLWQLQVDLGYFSEVAGRELLEDEAHSLFEGMCNEGIAQAVVATLGIEVEGAFEGHGGGNGMGGHGSMMGDGMGDGSGAGASGAEDDALSAALGFTKPTEFGAGTPFISATEFISAQDMLLSQDNVDNIVVNSLRSEFTHKGR